MKYTDICPVCGFNAQREFDICLKCGLIVEKYYAKQLERAQREAEEEQKHIKQTQLAEIVAETKVTADKARIAMSENNNDTITPILATVGGIIGMIHCWLSLNMWISLSFLNGPAVYWYLAANLLATLPATVIAILDKYIGGALLILSGIFSICLFTEKEYSLAGAIIFGLPSICVGFCFFKFAPERTKKIYSDTDFISATERRNCAIIFPNIILILGYIKLFSMIFEQESVGYLGVILLAIIPLVVAISVFVSNFIVPRKCRESVHA